MHRIDPSAGSHFPFARIIVWSGVGRVPFFKAPIVVSNNFIAGYSCNSKRANSNTYDLARKVELKALKNILKGECKLSELNKIKRCDRKYCKHDDHHQASLFHNAIFSI